MRALLALLLLGGSALPASAGPLLIEREAAGAPHDIQVSLPGVADGGVMPIGYTANGHNLSPPISWTAGPQRTAGYAVVMEDGAPGVEAPVRWIAYQAPAGLTALPRGIHNLAAPLHPLGLLQGRNDHGGVGYAGPRPGAGDPPHPYHIEVFALDRQLNLPPGVDLERLARAMDGHVLAKGELVLTYPGPPSTKPPSPAALP